jgi:DNA-binding winged helix-turn-helix (wHTH) protein/tetratricopeptide (TPR) repeat protein
VSAQVFEFGPFRLDADKQVLWRDREVVSLTPKALALLHALVESGGDVVPKPDLMTRVWPDTAVQDANLSVTVAMLRRVLGVQEGGRSWIETVPRRGYRFDGPVTAPASASDVHLAVLPFEVLGPGAEPHIGLGLADALISRLTGLEGLRVRPTAAVTHLSGQQVAPREAAADLGVDVVLTGTLRQEGERVRLSLQCVPRRIDLRPWARQVDTRFTDLFSVEDRLAEEVATLLHARLAPSARAPSAYVPAREAWESYVRGRYFEAWLNVDGVSKAIGHFGEAAMRDPRWAAPHAGLADAHVLLTFAGAAPPREAWGRAAECVERALERDPRLAPAHAVGAWIALFRDWDWDGARRQLQRALTHEPDSHVIRLLFGVFLDLAGDTAAARREIEDALETDPLSGLAAVAQAFFHDPEGTPERWLTAARRGVELRPDGALGYWGLALARVAAGQADRAVDALYHAVELSDDGIVMRAQLGWGLARAGRHDAARTLLTELEGLEQSAYVSRYHLAVLRLALGERAEALDDLERAADDLDPWIVFMEADAALLDLRGEPRFDNLVARVRGRD